MDSRTYDNIDFTGISAKVEISGVIKKTTQLLDGMYFAELANTAKRRISEFTRARVNSLITCCIGLYVQ
jgi:hypothetical protein